MTHKESYWPMSFLWQRIQVPNKLQGHHVPVSTKHQTQFAAAKIVNKNVLQSSLQIASFKEHF